MTRRLVIKGELHKRLRSGLSRIYFPGKLKHEPCFCTEILSQIVTWYKKDDVTKKNHLCLEFVTKKACLFEVHILDAKHECWRQKTNSKTRKSVSSPIVRQMSDGWTTINGDDRYTDLVTDERNTLSLCPPEGPVNLVVVRIRCVSVLYTHPHMYPRSLRQSSARLDVYTEMYVKDHVVLCVMKWNMVKHSSEGAWEVGGDIVRVVTGPPPSKWLLWHRKGESREK
jgi:hypothetical protein